MVVRLNAGRVNGHITPASRQQLFRWRKIAFGCWGKRIAARQSGDGHIGRIQIKNFFQFWILFDHHLFERLIDDFQVLCSWLCGCRKRRSPKHHQYWHGALDVGGHHQHHVDVYIDERVTAVVHMPDDLFGDDRSTPDKFFIRNFYRPGYRRDIIGQSAIQLSFYIAYNFFAPLIPPHLGSSDLLAIFCKQQLRKLRAGVGQGFIVIGGIRS